MWEKEKLLIMINFFFSNIVSKGILPMGRINIGLSGYGLRLRTFSYFIRKRVWSEKGNASPTESFE